MNKTTLFSIAWPVTVITAFVGGQFAVSSNSAPEEENSKEKKVVRTVSRSSSRSSSHSLSGLTREELQERVIQTTEVTKAEFENNFGIQKIMKLSNPIQRASLLLNVIENMNSDDFLTVVDDFRSLGITAQRRGEYTQLLHAWAQVDPQAALSYSLENQASSTAENIILSSWVKNNPTAAIEWVEANHNGEGANPYKLGLIQGLLEDSPEIATELLEGLPSSSTRYSAIRALTDSFSSADTEKGLAWLDTLTDPNIRSQASQRLISNFAKEDPAAVAEWTLSIDNKSLQNNSLRILSNAWAGENLSDATEWVSTLNSEQKITAAQGIVREFVDTDPEQALQWVQGMQNEEGYQGLLGSYISSAARLQEFGTALSQIPSLTDSTAQARAYATNLSRWHQSDPEAVQAWLGANQISEEAMRLVQSSIKQVENRTRRTIRR